ncbi:MAG: transcriptional regulator [Syntrophomonadaceae bacterium]|nr:transcriptional regulator [Syntrophomonadaceae bacterium]
MCFYEKLDILMNLTKTSNSLLARHMSFDPSYISRLRSGKRLPPRNEDVVKKMAEYFACRCDDGYRRKAIADIMELSTLPEDAELLVNAIAQWMLPAKVSKQEPGIYLNGLSGTKDQSMPSMGIQNFEESFPNEELTLYYGVEGKRLAVLYLLNEIIAQDKPQSLLLFSDEETSWMTGDIAHKRQYAALMIKALSRGHTIKIIHTVSRNLDEMLSAISQWMPLYMAGTIEPYYYPKKRDGIFRRSLFIVPGTAAVVSNSVGEQTANSVNLLFRNPTAVASFQGEYLQYLSMCRPLMHIFNAKDRADYLATLAEFEEEKSNVLLKSESLSLTTMPEELFSQMLCRTQEYNANMLDYHKTRIKKFQKLLLSHRVTEIVVLPQPKEVVSGKVKMALSDMLDGGTVYYTLDEYLLHLHNVIKHLDLYENYHVHLTKRPIENRYSVYVREERGAIVAKTSQPPVALFMNEGNMIASYWDFLKSIIKENAYENPRNTFIASALRAYVNKLSNTKR